jgi:hypothetical protein
MPMTACGQLAHLCHDDTAGTGATCHQLGHAGDEAACGAQLQTGLAACTSGGDHPAHGHSTATPCSGLCADPVSFSVADGTLYSSGPLGSEAGCYETTSQLFGGLCTWLGGRSVLVNGKVMPCGGIAGAFTYPLPSQRHHGYCIQASAGQPAAASFSVF